MYRKYREGDLPDIQIKHSDLITPLQALAQVRLSFYSLPSFVSKDEQTQIELSPFSNEAFINPINEHEAS